MKASALLGFLVLVLLFASCTRSAPSSSATPGPNAANPARAAPAQPLPAAPRPVDTTVVYQPGRERVLRESDGQSLGMEWKSLGMAVPAIPGDVHYGLLFADAPLLSATGDPQGRTITSGARVSVLDVGAWEDTGTGFRRLFRVRQPAQDAEGWIDGGSLSLITAEAGELAAGIVPRKIVVGGGDAEYNLLAIVDRGKLTLVDTSMFPFADEFHPSAVLRVSIIDANGNGNLEVVVEAETIVSLRYLGASALRWVAWLRPRDGTWTPILQYNASFGTDAGYSYTTTMRAFDASGAGMMSMVRLDTEYVLVSGESEFRSNTVSFYPWNGSSYRKAPLQDLPRRGTVATDQAPLLKEPDGESTGSLARGDVLFVFDRSDTRQSPDDASSWWYRVVAKSGAEGWISGTGVDLSWVDPLKENRAVFLGQATPP